MPNAFSGTWAVERRQFGHLAPHFQHRTLLGLLSDRIKNLANEQNVIFHGYGSGAAKQETEAYPFRVQASVAILSGFVHR